MDQIKTKFQDTSFEMQDQQNDSTISQSEGERERERQWLYYCMCSFSAFLDLKRVDQCCDVTFHLSINYKIILLTCFVQSFVSTVTFLSRNRGML